MKESSKITLRSKLLFIYSSIEQKCWDGHRNYWEQNKGGILYEKEEKYIRNEKKVLGNKIKVYLFFFENDKKNILFIVFKKQNKQ